jgi:hypothetical protein
MIIGGLAKNPQARHRNAESIDHVNAELAAVGT